MSIFDALQRGLKGVLEPPPPGHRVPLRAAYDPEAYDKELLLKEIYDAINDTFLPDKWKKHYLANFESEFEEQQRTRPRLISAAKESGVTLGPLTLNSVLLNLRHRCFKARIYNMLKSEKVKKQGFLLAGAPPDAIEANERGTMNMFLLEIINGFGMHPADYNVDANGLPIAAKNERAELYHQPPPTGCELPLANLRQGGGARISAAAQIARFASRLGVGKNRGGKRKTKKRKTKKRKTKKRVPSRFTT
jgi:hypothetical protein